MPENPRDAEAIRAGIERARQEIEQSVNALRANVSDTLNWRSFVRRHPGATFAGAMVVGLLIARATTRSTVAETRGKTQLPMSEISAPSAEEAARAFQRGVELGREYAETALRRVAAWAEENPGQLLLAGVAVGFLLGKLLFSRPRSPAEELG